MRSTTLDLLNLSYQNLHLTTLLTYLASGAVGYILAPKYRIAFGIGVTSVAAFSYESLYLGFDVLFSGGHGFGITNIFLYTGTIYFVLLGLSFIVKPKIDKWLVVLVVLDLAIWAAWLPSYHATKADRLWVIPSKTILTLAFLVPFRGNVIPRLVDRFYR